MLAQNNIFTAEPPRTQRNNFLFVGRYRQTKKLLFYYRRLTIGSIAIKGFDLIPEGTEFLLQSPSPACADEAVTARRRPDWSRKNLPLR